MIDIVGIDCCGCTACHDICPKKAIKINQNEAGFLYPVINHSQCIKCNLCDKVCPILNISNENHNIIRCVAGYSKDSELVQGSTSGGISTTLSLAFLNKKGIVYGASYNSDFKKVSTIRVNQLNQLDKIKGSKYVQSDKRGIYELVRKDLENKKDVLFTGTPCEIAAIKSYLKRDYENLFTCEIVCHGPTSPKALKKFVEYEEKLHKSLISSFNMRYKQNGWGRTNTILRIGFCDRQIEIQNLYETMIGKAFYYMPRESCYRCRFKINKSVADITVGDFWGADINSQYYNTNGTSIIFIHTKKGDEQIKKLRDFFYEEVNFDDAIVNNNSVVNSRIRKPESYQFCNNFKKNIELIDT